MAQLYWPFPLSTVTEWPGQRPGSYHIGTDYGVPQGTPLRATVDGTIRRWADQYGAWCLDIIAANGTRVHNGHLSRMDAATGQRVNAGDVIGLTGGIPGTPGAGWSTGAHLHQEIWIGGRWQDPRNIQPPLLHFGEPPKPKPEPYRIEDEMTVLVANEDQPGIFAVIIDGKWKDLDTGRPGQAQVEAINKITTAENNGKARATVNLSGEQWAVTKGLYS